jgi:UPF0716 family protein affecting phage T7 exclusion
MQTSSPSMVVQALVMSVVCVIAAAWWLTVPGVMTSSTFIALCGILAASGWVVKSTSMNAQPASSLAQSLHDVEAAQVNPVRRG